MTKYEAFFNNEGIDPTVHSLCEVQLVQISPTYLLHQLWRSLLECYLVAHQSHS